MRGSLRPVARTNGSASALPAASNRRPADATRIDIDHRGTFMSPPHAARGRTCRVCPASGSCFFCVIGSVRSSVAVCESKTRRVAPLAPDCRGRSDLRPVLRARRLPDTLSKFLSESQTSLPIIRPYFLVVAVPAHVPALHDLGERRVSQQDQCEPGEELRRQRDHPERAGERSEG